MFPEINFIKFIDYYFLVNEVVEVTGLDPNKLGRLSVLELRGNKLMSTAGVNLANLKELYLVRNWILLILFLIFFSF